MIVPFVYLYYFVCFASVKINCVHYIVRWRDCRFVVQFCSHAFPLFLPFLVRFLAFSAADVDTYVEGTYINRFSICNCCRFAVSDINMAFNQATFMSTVLIEYFCPPGCSSELAVDGDHSTTIARCSVTARENNPWWAVELLNDDNIAKVVVNNRDFYGRKEAHLAVLCRHMRHRAEYNTSTDSISKAN